jgi:hypothetical protein
MLLGRTKHPINYQVPVVAAPPTAPSLQRRPPQPPALEDLRPTKRRHRTPGLPNGFARGVSDSRLPLLKV